VRAVEAGIEARHLGHAGKGRHGGADAGEVVRLVQRGKGRQRLEFGNQGFVDERRRGVIDATVHDAMADGVDSDAGNGLAEGRERGAQCHGMVRHVPGGDHRYIASVRPAETNGARFADSVDEAGRHRRVALERVQRELEGRRARVEGKESAGHDAPTAATRA
jgi:hypothetical protein